MPRRSASAVGLVERSPVDHRHGDAVGAGRRSRAASPSPSRRRRCAASPSTRRSRRSACMRPGCRSGSGRRTGSSIAWLTKTKRQRGCGSQESRRSRRRACGSRQRECRGADAERLAAAARGRACSRDLRRPSRRRSLHEPAPSRRASAAASATKIPASIAWNVQNRSAGWNESARRQPSESRYSCGSIRACWACRIARSSRAAEMWRPTASTSELLSTQSRAWAPGTSPAIVSCSGDA